MPNVYIREITTREIVKTVEVKSPSPRYVEKLVRGMLRNLNTDDYFVDDSECDD